MPAANRFLRAKTSRAWATTVESQSGRPGDLRVVADSMVQEQSLEHLAANRFVIVGPQPREQGSIGRALCFWVVVTTRPSSMA